MIKSLYKLLLLLALLTVGQSCEDYLNVNENPNVATEPPLNGLLAAGSYQTGLNHFRVSNFTSYFVQYLASPNANGTTDTYQEADYSGTWTSLYNTMTDLYDLVELGEEQGARHHVGMARIMMAMNLGLIADAWGSAPYSGAFTGETLTPSYDEGGKVYDEIQNLLDAAIADLQAADNQVTVGAGSDFIHGGDIQAWLKTAHGLKARYLNHLSRQSAYNATAVLAEVDQSYTTNDDDAQVTSFQVRNPWAQVAINNDNLLLDGWLSEQFIDALNGKTFGVVDPRLPLITVATPSGEFIGTPNGSGRRGDGTVQVECYIEVSGAYSMPTSPLLVFTNAELRFIEAEAAFRANQKGRALTAFLAGVAANMDKVGVTEGDRTKYLADAYPNLDENSLTLNDIFREKYVALFLQPETWADARRHDYQYADFTLPANANLTEFIRRVQYPSVELDRNQSNVPTVNSLAERLFWDQ